MTEADATRSLVIEREMSYPPEKIWRALTQRPLIEDWLMRNDFEPVVGHRFNFRATPMPHWNGVVDCEVLVVAPYERLSYSWNASGEEAAGGLRTVVTWTLTPTEGGTRLRMEQSGFRPEDEANYQGASYGWQRFVAGLEQVLAGLD
ncbi:MAG: SRPBCC family protein [Geminicoccaceae bacterium]